MWVRRDLVVTFDLFSALIDSRTGGSRHFARLAEHRGWCLSGTTLFDTWDRNNKMSQRSTTEWITFAEHSSRALRMTYQHFGLTADADADARGLLAHVSAWPIWPGVAEDLPRIAQEFSTGILSNVDDDVFRRTRVASLVGDAHILTSERLGAYKPDANIYTKALAHAGQSGYVHVASSARDVRGALESGIRVIRLVRPGHVVDPDGPAPAVEVESLDGVVRQLRAGFGNT